MHPATILDVIDDEDGVTFPSLTQGQSATIDVAVTGAGGYLQAWIDWDGDDNFTGASDQIATDLQDDGTNGDATAGDGVINVAVTAPATATTNQTFARFRWSTTQGLDATSAAADGEVEDYPVTIALGQSAFSCSPDFGQVYGSNGTIGLIDLTSQSFNVLGDTGITLNAAGFRPEDGFVYAMSGRALYRIGSGGSTTNLGQIAGLPSGSANQGDFGPDGHLHIRYGGSLTVYRVNVETATLDGSYALSPAIGDLSDFAYVASRGQFVGIRGYGATPRVTAFSPSGATQPLGRVDFSSVAFGAAFSDSSGAFFAFNNNTGVLYEFDVTTGASIALGQGTPAGLNDGFPLP